MDAMHLASFFVRVQLDLRRPTSIDIYRNRNDSNETLKSHTSFMARVRHQLRVAACASPSDTTRSTSATSSTAGSAPG